MKTNYNKPRHDLMGGFSPIASLSSYCFCLQILQIIEFQIEIKIQVVDDSLSSISFGSDILNIKCPQFS